MRLDVTSIALSVTESDGLIHLTVPVIHDNSGVGNDQEVGDAVAKSQANAVTHFQLERNGGMCVDLAKNGNTLYTVLTSLTSWATATTLSDTGVQKEYDAVMLYIVRLIRNAVAGFRFQKLAFFENHLDEPLCNIVVDEQLRSCISASTMQNIALCAASLLNGSSLNNSIELRKSEPTDTAPIVPSDEETAELRQLHQNIYASKLLQCVSFLLQSHAISGDRQQKRVREILLTAFGQFFFDTEVTTPDGSAITSNLPSKDDYQNDVLTYMVQQLSAVNDQSKSSTTCKSRLISTLAYACSMPNNARLLNAMRPDSLRFLLELIAQSPSENTPIYENTLLCVLRLVLFYESNRLNPVNDAVDLMLMSTSPLEASSSESPVPRLSLNAVRAISKSETKTGDKMQQMEKNLDSQLLLPLVESNQSALVRVRAATVLALWHRRGVCVLADCLIRQKLIPLLVRFMKKSTATSTALQCEAADGLGVLLQGNEELQRIAAWTDGLILKVFADIWREYSLIMPKIAQSSNNSMLSNSNTRAEQTTEDLITQNLRDVSHDTIELWRAFLFCFSCLIEQCEDVRRMLQSHCTNEELAQRNNPHPLRHLTTVLSSSSTPTTALHINDRLLDPVLAAIKPGMPEPLVHAALRFMLSLSRSVRQLRTAFCEQLVWIEIVCLLKSYYPSIRDAPSRRASNASQKQQNSSATSSSGLLTPPVSTATFSLSLGGGGRRKFLRPNYSWTSPSRRNRLLAATVLCNMLLAPPPNIKKLQLLRLDHRDVERDEQRSSSYARFSTSKQQSDEAKDSGSNSSISFTIQQLLSAYGDADQQTSSERAADEAANAAFANQSSLPPSPLSVGSLLRELVEELENDKQICLTGVWCLMNISFGCQTVAEKVSALQIITPRTLEQLLLHCCDENFLILQCTLGIMRNCVPVSSSMNGNSDVESDADYTRLLSSGGDTAGTGRTTNNKKFNASQTSRSIMKHFMPLLVAVMEKYFAASFQPTATEIKEQLPQQQQPNPSTLAIIREQILATLARFADNRYGARLLMQTADALNFIRESLSCPPLSPPDSTTSLTVPQLAVSCITLLLRRESSNVDDNSNSSESAALFERRRIFIDRGFARLLYALREQMKTNDTIAGRALAEQVRTALFHMNNNNNASTFYNSSSFSASSSNRDNDDGDDNDGNENDGGDGSTSSEPMQIS